MDASQADCKSHLFHFIFVYWNKNISFSSPGSVRVSVISWIEVDDSGKEFFLVTAHCHVVASSCGTVMGHCMDQGASTTWYTSDRRSSNAA